jgi:hypothetical protein
MPDILQVTENGRLKLKEDHPYYYQVKIYLQSMQQNGKKTLTSISHCLVLCHADTDITVVRRFVVYL